ncbi:hypothetical protein [Pseudobacteroides cellulosolvens]|uniref:Phosphoribosyltransferase n=1 Tax=Pseudobacteroides cellulosolvens ATCC 35603 = DSM 2933 TaxID=398512 RepID=A0A0L6JHY2_9FIRM|nr:hypothetical protein [Pseudobacteroides cellulosolvens]KNY25334.1 hypothetical protein Bccel_0594 [Pseudobacteroides cellulosolvens ATCC 35603 = DSM 2933]
MYAQVEKQKTLKKTITNSQQKKSSGLIESKLSKTFLKPLVQYKFDISKNNQIVQRTETEDSAAQEINDVNWNGIIKFVKILTSKYAKGTTLYVGIGSSPEIVINFLKELGEKAVIIRVGGLSVVDRGMAAKVSSEESLFLKHWSAVEIGEENMKDASIKKIIILDAVSSGDTLVAMKKVISDAFRSYGTNKSVEVEPITLNNKGDMLVELGITNVMKGTRDKDLISFSNAISNSELKESTRTTPRDATKIDLLMEKVKETEKWIEKEYPSWKYDQKRRFALRHMQGLLSDEKYLSLFDGENEEKYKARRKYLPVKIRKIVLHERIRGKIRELQDMRRKKW